MLRTILLAAVLMSGMAVKGQTAPSFGAMNNAAESVFQHPQQLNDSSKIHKKWFVTKYAGISTGFMGFKGESSTFLSVPLALQLNRQLTNNFYAFGEVSATPSVFRYNSIPYQPAISKNNSFLRTNNFAAYSEAKIGVMYISNDKTFSISGSVGVGSGTNSGYAPFYAPMYSPLYAPMGGHLQR